MLECEQSFVVNRAVSARSQKKEIEPAADSRRGRLEGVATGQIPHSARGGYAGCADEAARQVPITPPSFLVTMTVAERGRPPAASGHWLKASGLAAT